VRRVADDDQATLGVRRRLYFVHRHENDAHRVVLLHERELKTSPVGHLHVARRQSLAGVEQVRIDLWRQSLPLDVQHCVVVPGAVPTVLTALIVPLFALTYAVDARGGLSCVPGCSRG
jgi:hypothetical protein